MNHHYGVLKEHLIRHVLRRQNGGSTNCPILVKITSVRNISRNTSNEVNYTEEVKDHKFYPNT